jgi:DNA polymerase II small subunit/DNA polymerase delta subunit B
MKDIKHLEDVLQELHILMLRKHQDYGPYNIANAPGGAMNGLIIRMHDKLERLQNLYYKKSDTPNYESIEDTLQDLANYAIIGLMVQRGQWEGAGGPGFSK